MVHCICSFSHASIGCQNDTFGCVGIGSRGPHWLVDLFAKGVTNRIGGPFAITSCPIKVNDGDGGGFR